MVEARSRAYVENRVRAGVLEQGSVDTLREAGLDARLRREGLVHEGIQIQIGEHRHRLDLKELTGGKVITVYGQQEVVKDLIAQRLADKGAILFEAENAAIHDFDGRTAAHHLHARRASEARSPATSSPAATAFTASAGHQSRKARSRSYDRVYPFAWLGILAKAEPASEEVIYVNHPRGFALSSMRSHEVARLYLQCRPDENLSELAGRAHLGGVARAPAHRALATPSMKDKCSRRASPGCAASSPSRCVMAGCSSRAMPPISCRRREPRA